MLHVLHALDVWVFTWCTFFMLHSLHVALFRIVLFSCFAISFTDVFFVLRFFRFILFSCCTLLRYPYFIQFSCFLCVSLFSFCKCCIHVSLFSSCIFFVWTFFIQHSFRVAFFSYCTRFMPFFFRAEVCSCCFYCVALFSCCTLFVLHSFHVALPCVYFFRTALFYKTSEQLHLFHSCLTETYRFLNK